MTSFVGLPAGHSIDTMSRAEVALLESWAIAEGWNPGVGDVELAVRYDPDAFIALRRGDELIGGGAILAHGSHAGFMGLFIMRPDCRGQGLGRVLWHERLRRLRARLEPDAPIEMDGVFNMVPFYSAGGFRLLHRDLRFQGVARHGVVDGDVVPLGQWPVGSAAELDASVSGIERRAFIERWLSRPGVRAVGWESQGRLAGLAGLRPAGVGWKFGPVIADSPEVARRMLCTLLAGIEGDQVQFDLPESNAAALSLAHELGLQQVFGCARMVNGRTPAAEYSRLYGVASFEFG